MDAACLISGCTGFIIIIIIVLIFVTEQYGKDNKC